MSKKKTSKKSSKKTESLDFEASMGELESLVERMEEGDQSLEDSLKDFERGIALTRRCQKSLQETEQKIQQLIEKNGQDELVDFDEG
ncbi:MAG: exodeoxyribonuclease VII small subunit [Gammaproteobacteria bacterium]|nr:MAG: exodeoxyribonuclease VII small subunit [Gammaproteobacteria bacterium]